MQPKTPALEMPDVCAAVMPRDWRMLSKTMPGTPARVAAPTAYTTAAKKKIRIVERGSFFMIRMVQSASGNVSRSTRITPSSSLDGARYFAAAMRSGWPFAMA